MMPRGDKLILAPPPEYAVSGGWALRGAPPQGALLAPCQRHDGIPGRVGDDIGSEGSSGLAGKGTTGLAGKGTTGKAAKGMTERARRPVEKSVEKFGKRWKKMEKYSYLCSQRERRIDMITFIGEYSAKIDDKGRVVFPSPFKSLIPAEGDARFVVKKDIFEDCLEMYTFEEWERQSEEVKSKLNFFNRAHAAFWREYMRNRAIVEPDAKLGRISIPKKLLESIGVTKEVVFSGNDYKIEIWAKERYEASEISNEEFLNIAGQLSQQR